MMKTINNILIAVKIFSLLSVIVFLIFGSYFFFTLIKSTKQITQQVSSVLDRFESTLVYTDNTLYHINGAVDQTGKSVLFTAQQISKTINIINNSCSPGPCGTLANVNKTLNTIRGTFGQIEIAANHEDKNLTMLDNQETQLFQDSHNALAGIVPMESEFDKTIFDTDSLVNSKDVISSIHNLNTVTYNIGQSTTDFQNKFHDFLYPPPCKGFRCHLKTGYEIIKAGSSLAEPAYWADQLFKAIP